MAFFSNIFSKNKKTKTLVIEEPIEIVKNDISIPADLSYIEDTLVKLELINISHGENEYLTEKLSLYQNRLKEIKENKDDIECPSIFNRYDRETRYKLNLSNLKDEIECFSRTWFYLEELDVFLYGDITLSNIEDRKKELLTLESKIKSYHDKEEETDKKLQEKLIEAIRYLLEKEILLEVDKNFYSRISDTSKRKIEKIYFQKLAEKAKNDEYIQKYLKERNISSLEFDYDMFSYLVLGKKIPVTEVNLNTTQPIYVDDNLEMTLLEKDQIFGDTALKIFEKRGTKAALSDYAILSGGYVSNFSYVGDNNRLENRTGYYWTETDNGENDTCIVSSKGCDHNYYVNSRDGGARPTLSFSSISNICKNLGKAEDGILEVEYGEYPQSVASKDLQEILENLFQKGNLVRTGKIYTRDKTAYDDYDQKFQEDPQEEYEYNGKKYVRVKANSCKEGNKFTLSNGEQYQDGDYVWVEVEPIKWLVDEENNIAVTEKLLFAGVQFKNTRDYDGNFENTDLYWYLNEYFAKEMIPSKCVNLNVYNKKEKYKRKSLAGAFLDYINPM